MDEVSPTPVAPSTPPPQVPTPVLVEQPPAVAPVTPPAPADPPKQETPPVVPVPTPKKKMPMQQLIMAAGLLVGGLLVGFALGHYAFAPATKTADQTNQQTTTQTKKLEIPRDATVIAECAVGRGKQYVLPKDIPTGPVYNVWNNEVIGVEFMVGRDELLSENKNFINLPLGGATYDHINVGLLSQGHSGFTQPHYHVDLFTVSNDEAQKITCK